MKTMLAATLIILLEFDHKTEASKWPVPHKIPIMEKAKIDETKDETTLLSLINNAASDFPIFKYDEIQLTK